MNVTAITLGCKVNQYETEVMLTQLLSSGFQLEEIGRPADVVLINSCTVTSSSDQKVRQALHKARRDNPDAVLVLTGCMPQAFPEEAEKLTDADIIIGNTNRKDLLNHILDYLAHQQRIIDILPHDSGEKFNDAAIHSFHDHTRAFLKIEDGCNRFCSYCIIPYARGRVRSKPLSVLAEEVSDLAENGFQEIVLTGINLSCYGQDLNLHLCDAVETAASSAKIRRIRLGSLEPEQLSTDVISRLSEVEKLCPQFHLSLQSGSNGTLRRMNRHYTAEEYHEIVNNLRSAFPDCAITTDIMVGFPGETDSEFRESLAFAEKIGFARTHVFAYSRRPGTKAYNAPDQVSSQTKTARSRQMSAVASTSKELFLQKQTGTIQEVLIEREIRPGVFEGYTKNYTQVHICEPCPLNTVMSVRITDAASGICIGKPVC